MKVLKHGSYLQQLVQYGMVNCYFVVEDDGLTLIDAGLPGNADKLTTIAKQQGKPITRIALTHPHSDHVGSFEAICAQWPDADIAVSARTADFLAGNLDLQSDEPQVKLKGQYVACKIKPTHILQAGDQFGSLTVIDSSGHTPGHTAFFDERDKTLIAGDSFQTKAGLAVAGTIRWLFPLPAFATWHKPTALESARRLHALNPSRLAVGHGIVLENPTEAMAVAIQEASS
ncbi:MAG: MBL fold metallo-hydrolase [Chloroflexota bacterium]